MSEEDITSFAAALLAALTGDETDESETDDD
jgi:hypothetical protein